MRDREKRRRRVVEEETDKVNWLSPCTEMLIQLISIGANILPYSHVVDRQWFYLVVKRLLLR